MKNQKKQNTPKVADLMKIIEEQKAALAALKAEEAERVAAQTGKVEKLKREDMFVNMDYNGNNIYGTLVNAIIEQNGEHYFYLEGGDGLIRKFNKKNVDGNYLPDIEEKVNKLMNVRRAVAAAKRGSDPAFED